MKKKSVYKTQIKSLTSASDLTIISSRNSLKESLFLAPQNWTASMEQ